MENKDLYSLVNRESMLEKLVANNNEIFKKIEQLEHDNEWYYHKFNGDTYSFEIEQMKKKNILIEKKLCSNLDILHKEIAKAYFKKYNIAVNDL